MDQSLAEQRQGRAAASGKHDQPHVGRAPARRRASRPPGRNSPARAFDPAALRAHRGTHHHENIRRAAQRPAAMPRPECDGRRPRALPTSIGSPRGSHAQRASAAGEGGRRNRSSTRQPNADASASAAVVEGTSRPVSIALTPARQAGAARQLVLRPVPPLSHRPHVVVKLSSVCHDRDDSTTLLYHVKNASLMEPCRAKRVGETTLMNIRTQVGT